jgi:hypothetical protein
MELDPIVLLAYVSVAVNILTLVAAAIAYAIFRIRRRRRAAPAAGSAGAALPAPPFEPVFLKPYRPPLQPGAAVPAAGKEDPHA